MPYKLVELKGDDEVVKILAEGDDVEELYAVRDALQEESFTKGPGSMKLQRFAVRAGFSPRCARQSERRGA